MKKKFASYSSNPPSDKERTYTAGKTAQCQSFRQPTEMDIEVFRAVAEHFRQDLREFFTRSNFYLIAQAALISVFFTREPPKNNIEYVMSMGIILCGLIFAIFWWLVARGSVIWIDRWRDELRRLDALLDRLYSFVIVEAQALRHPYQSAERVTQYLALIFCFMWSSFMMIWLVMWKISLT